MKTAIHKIILLIVGLPVCSNVYAYDFEEDGIYYNILTTYGENQVEVTYGDEEENSYTMEKVVIPAKVKYGGKEFSVRIIGNKAFNDCDKILSVELPNTITTIDAAAFYNCSNIKTVNIPPSLKKVGYMAFNGCSNLKEVHITDLSAWCRIEIGSISPNDGLLGNGSNLIFNGEIVTDLTIPDDVTEINGCAFTYCPSITSVTVSDNVKLIGSCAFANCSNLKKVAVSDDLELIGEDAFHGTAWLEAQNDGPIYLGNILCDFKGEMPENYDLQIKDGTKAVMPNLFNGADNLHSVSIPKSVNFIGPLAFSICNNLREINVAHGNERYCSIDGVLFDKVLQQLITYPAKKTDIFYTIPEWVTSIYYAAFSRADNLLSISMSDKVTAIYHLAFQGCMNLSSIRLSENLQTIGQLAFNACLKLRSISLPKSVTSIGSNAFIDCRKLETIYSYNPIPPTLEIREDPYYGKSYPFDDSTYDNAYLIVPTGSYSLYSKSEGWNKFKKISVGLPNAGVESVDTSGINVTVQNSSIVVSGSDGKGEIEVYNASGQLIYSGTDTTINVPAKGIYIVSVAGQTFKVAL